MILRSSVALITASFILCLANAATPIPAPTNLRASGFDYNSIAKIHRFVFEWDAAKQANGAPYTKYQLSRGKGCGYEPLNAGDTIAGVAATWVVTITGPRYGVTVVCGCPRRTIGYTGVVKTAGEHISAPAYITRDAIQAGHQWPDVRYPYNILMACT